MEGQGSPKGTVATTKKKKLVKVCYKGMTWDTLRTFLKKIGERGNANSEETA